MIFHYLIRLNLISCSEEKSRYKLNLTVEKSSVTNLTNDWGVHYFTERTVPDQIHTLFSGTDRAYFFGLTSDLDFFWTKYFWANSFLSIIENSRSITAGFEVAARDTDIDLSPFS